MGQLTYTVRLGSLNGEIIGTYTQAGPDEPMIGSLLDEASGLPDGAWRVSEFVQTDDSAPSKNVLVVEPAAG